MNQIIHIARAAILTVTASFTIFACNVRQQEPAEQVLFESRVTDTIPYRIPAIAELGKGKLIALADYRYCKSDIGWGRVDIHGRMSGDYGRTWGEEFTLIEGTGVSKAVDCGFGDAAIVADHASKDVLVMMVCGETIYWHESTTRQNTNRISILRSKDNGKTWSQWEEITESVYSLFDDCQYGCVQSCFVGSGKICQSKRIKVGSHYRIYAALCARPNGNRVIYSDDFGHTWNILSSADDLPAIHGDEPKCEELPSGSVVLSSRAWGGRYFNIYRYSDEASAEGQWGETAGSGPRNNGCTALSNSCNGELLIIPARRTTDNKKAYLALQSVPLGPDRMNVGIYYKELPDGISDMTPEQFAADWETPYQVSDKPSAYSTMIQMSNGNIAFYYEEIDNCCPNGFNMVYKELTLETITSGRYQAGR